MMNDRNDNFPKTLQEAIKYFADLDTCNTIMMQLRWPDGVTCPVCKGTAVSYISTRRMWKCKNKECKKQFSVKVGTVMEDSPIGLDKWLTAMWLLANAKNGISSYEVHRALGVSQRTAWFLMHRIRLAMQAGTFEKIKGTAECDETFVGGLSRNMHKKAREAKITGPGGCGKAIVFGILERHGEGSKVRAKVIFNRSQETLQGEVRRNVEAGAAVYTDAHRSYLGLSADYVHEFTDHAEEYVRGNVHTNGIENFWSLLKRGIKGTYVSVEACHLSRYLDEQAFRFNTRKGKDADRFLEVARNVTGKRLTYSELTGKDALDC